MPVYRLTPEEIRALLGQGLIVFNQRHIKAPHQKRETQTPKQEAESPAENRQGDDHD